MNNLLPKCCCLPTKDNRYFNQVLYAATSCEALQLIMLSGVEKLVDDSKDELKGFASWMNDGLKFIENILKIYSENITSEALNECQRILEGVYVLVITELNKLLDEEDRVDEKKFKSVYKTVSEMLEVIYEKEEQAFMLSHSSQKVSDIKKGDDKKEDKPPSSNTPPTGY